ncbi:uncharacterized protein LOC126988546 isoform X3 [Eriocheir sinensis]|uniref:uncharacterized protein LOC126988546 isoform X3 n=1 Tax=Eriocheir sinensis TaxID=95602 RepID=UPI0021C699A4|nr:uncharacterized protein LOC126988546 isoform X3 [Eriocheir sinensis]
MQGCSGVPEVCRSARGVQECQGCSGVPGVCRSARGVPECQGVPEPGPVLAQRSGSAEAVLCPALAASSLPLTSVVEEAVGPGSSLSRRDQQEQTAPGVRIRGDQENHHHLAAGISSHKGKGTFECEKIGD